MGIILCRIVWADEYKSKKEHFFAGNMSYPAEYKIAHELLNFSNEKGFVYGYVENKGDRIGVAKLGASTEASRVDGTTVIWCALDRTTRRLRVVGWYDNAQVYRKPQVLPRGSARGKWKYQFQAKFHNAHLIPPAERYLEVPMKIKRMDKGFIGQRNWFFPEEYHQYQQFLQAFLLLKMSQKKETPRNRGEQESYEEGQRFVTEITVSIRNPKLVTAAKRRYGYRCQVCNFDFKERYGNIGEGFIEVHHLQPMATRRSQSSTSVDDVRVLCANCHRMIHQKPKPLDLDELKKMLRH